MERVITNLEQLGVAALYFIFALFALFLGRIVWDKISKYRSTKEIFEKNNVSAGIAEFGFLIALALIIAASVKGDLIKGTPVYIDMLVSLMDFVFGLIALGIAKFVLDIFTPFVLDEEISKDRNEGVGWLQAGFYIAIALILYNIL